MSRTEILSKEKLLTENIEQSIRQMRSIAQIKQTNFNWTKKIRLYLDRYMNYMEDFMAGRMTKE